MTQAGDHDGNSVLARDDRRVAGRVAELGLGRMLDPRISVTEIRDGIAAALADRAIKETSAAFVASLAEHPGIEDAVATVEDFVPRDRNR